MILERAEYEPITEDIAPTTMIKTHSSIYRNKTKSICQWSLQQCFYVTLSIETELLITITCVEVTFPRTMLRKQTGGSISVCTKQTMN